MIRSTLLLLTLPLALAASAPAQERFSVPISYEHMSGVMGALRSEGVNADKLVVFAGTEHEQRVSLSVVDGRRVRHVAISSEYLLTTNTASYQSAEIPYSSAQLNALIAQAQADGQRLVGALVEELKPFFDKAPVRYRSGERLILPAELYPELIDAVKAYAKQNAPQFKTAPNLRVEVVFDSPNHFSTHRAGPLLVAQIGVARLRQVATVEHLRVPQVWLRDRFAALWHKTAQPLQIPPSRFPALLEAHVRQRVRIEETKALFESVRMDLIANLTEAEAFRVRQVRLEFDLFNEAGVRSQWVEVFAEGHVQRHLGQELRRFTEPVLGIETYALEELERRFPHVEPRRVDLAERIKAALQRYVRPQSLATPYDRFRRADNTVDWLTATRKGAFQQTAGVTHFALALFLKELAVSLKTGNPQRIDEFFEFVTTTDFYVHYGLFAGGAHASNVLYGRYLATRIKPRHLNRIVRSNLVLAGGMALPAILSGNFEGQAFAISLGSLGLSSAAVRTGLTIGENGARLIGGHAPKAVARLRNLRKLTAAGGWLYTVGETALILYVGDEIADATQRRLDRGARRSKVKRGTVDFLLEALNPSVTSSRLSAALAAFDEAHVEFRNALYAPATQLEAEYQAALQAAAEDAKSLADREAALRDRLVDRPGLRERIVSDHGSIDAYLAAQIADDDATLEARLERIMETFGDLRHEALRAIYAPGKHSTYPRTPHTARELYHLLSNPPQGFLEKAKGYDYYRALHAMGGVREGRFQAYDDHASMLKLVHAEVLPSLRPLVEAELERVNHLKAAEQALYRGYMGDGGLTGSFQR